MGELSLRIPGEHNLLNALAALATAHALGLAPIEIVEGLGSFTGARRRFELKGEANGVRVIDDYGHHPTEIRVTLETARRYAGMGRVIVIFQPHRYSRTKSFAREFAEVLSLADEIFLLEIYPASEDPIPGVSSLMISNHMHSQANEVHFEPSMVDAVERAVASARSGDIIITLGAGDVSSLAPLIVKSLEH